MNRRTPAELKKLPTMTPRNAILVVTVLSEYLNTLAAFGHNRHVSLAAIAKKHKVTGCHRTLAAILYDLTGIKMRRGHNAFEADELNAAKSAVTEYFMAHCAKLKRGKRR